MKKEITIFLTAIMFYTRIPVPSGIGFSPDMLNKSTRYFPLVGIIIGSFGAFAFLLLNYIVPVSLAIIFSMVLTIFITGAFHEDGFTDFCDGFGGGYTKDQILLIMKDSRIGTYGAIGLILILATKFICISSLPLAEISLILIAAHAFSRVFPVLFIYSSEYVRENDQSKVKPIGHKDSNFALFVALFFGLIMLWFMPLYALIVIVPLSFLVFIVFRKYVIGKIGGYTGDVLGALQQLSELMFYFGYILYSYNLK